MEHLKRHNNIQFLIYGIIQDTAIMYVKKHMKPPKAIVVKLMKQVTMNSLINEKDIIIYVKCDEEKQ